MAAKVVAVTQPASLARNLSRALSALSFTNGMANAKRARNALNHSSVVYESDAESAVKRSARTSPHRAHRSESRSALVLSFELDFVLSFVLSFALPFMLSSESDTGCRYSL